MDEKQYQTMILLFYFPALKGGGTGGEFFRPKDIKPKQPAHGSAM